MTGHDVGACGHRAVVRGCPGCEEYLLEWLREVDAEPHGSAPARRDVAGAAMDAASAALRRHAYRHPAGPPERVGANPG